MAILATEEDSLENELNKGALWAITYGDLMTYLFIFFLLMFVNAETRSTEAQSSLTQRTDAAKTPEESTLDAQGIQEIAKVELQQDRIRLTFFAPVLFDEGYADVKPAAVPDLKKLAQALKNLSNSVVIEGHTDDVPLGARLMKKTGFRDNWQLSTARAIHVLRFLVDEGVPPARLAAVGYSEFHPNSPNTTDKGRAANRRIEVNILRQSQ